MSFLEGQINTGATPDINTARLRRALRFYELQAVVLMETEAGVCLRSSVTIAMTINAQF